MRDIDGKAENTVRIAVIDSGIDTGKSDMAAYVKKSTGYSFSSGGSIAENDGLSIRHEHGTLIAMVIRHICQAVEFISINILNEKLVTDGRILVYALGQAIELQPDIIHMSLGTTRWKYKYQLQRLINRADRQNILVVAAANGGGLKAYPACLRRVIKAGADPENDHNGYVWDGDSFLAPYDAKGIRGVEQLDSGDTAVGTSISAAYITGYLAAAKASSLSREYRDVINNLKIQANIRKEGVFR